MRSLQFYSKLLAPFVVAAAALHGPSAKAITTWDWSFTTNDPNISGSGTFTTADVTPEANVYYSLLGVSGSITYEGVASTITGISDFSEYWEANNTFAWNGTPTSSMIFDNGGIAVATGARDYLLYTSFLSVPEGESRLDTIVGVDGESLLFNLGINTTPSLIFTSSLQPRSNGPADVPGPLPLLGAGAAFGWSRRLRRRVSASTYRL